MPDQPHSADVTRLIFEREYYRELWQFALDRAQRAEAQLAAQQHRPPELRNTCGLDGRTEGEQPVKSKTLAA